MGHLSGLVDLVRGTRSLPAALLVLGCALSGCGATDPAASDPPSVSPSASPTGPTVPALPSAAREHTKAGAIAFVRHYIDLINYAQANVSYAPLVELDAKGCESCRQAHRHINDLRRRGAVVEGGRWKVLGFFAVARSTGANEFSVPASISYGPQVVRTSTSTKHYAGGKNVITFFPAWSGDGWVLNQWTRAK